MGTLKDELSTQVLFSESSNFMTSSKLTSRSHHGADHAHDLDFWQQLDKDFRFDGVDEEQLRQHTEQWITCASELLGPPPCRTQQKTKC